MHTGLRWQLLCRAGFPPERRVQGGEHSVILLKSAPLSCHPRVLQDLPALGTLGLAEGLGRAVMEILTPSQAVSSDDPWNSFPCGQTSFRSLELAHRVHFSLCFMFSVFSVRSLFIGSPCQTSSRPVFVYRGKSVLLPDAPYLPGCFVSLAASPHRQLAISLVTFCLGSHSPCNFKAS